MIVGTDSPRRDNDSLMALKNVIHSHRRGKRRPTRTDYGLGLHRNILRQGFDINICQ